jgi:hypothetical protein
MVNSVCLHLLEVVCTSLINVLEQYVIWLDKSQPVRLRPRLAYNVALLQEKYFIFTGKINLFYSCLFFPVYLSIHAHSLVQPSWSGQRLLLSLCGCLVSDSLAFYGSINNCFEIVGLMHDNTSDLWFWCELLVYKQPEDHHLQNAHNAFFWYISRRKTIRACS